MSLHQKLVELEAIIENSHFVYSSGKHGRSYVNWVKVLNNPAALWYMARQMVRIAPVCDVIAGPTSTGDKVAQALSLALFAEDGIETPCVYVQEQLKEVSVMSDLVGNYHKLEIVTPNRIIPRLQEEIVKGMDVLVADDVLNTGATILETIKAVERAGGRPIGVIVGCNRSEFLSYIYGLPLYYLLQIEIEQWDPGYCPDCIEGVAINSTVAHGDRFLKKYGENPANWPANSR